MDRGNVVWVSRGDESFGTRQMICSLADGLCGVGFTPGLITTVRGDLEEEWLGREWPLQRLPEWREQLPVADGTFRERLGAVRQWHRQEEALLAHLKLEHPPFVRPPRVRAVIGLRPYHLGAVTFLAKSAGAVPIWEMPNSLSPRRMALSRPYYALRLLRSPIRLVPLSQYSAATLGALRSRATVIYPAADGDRFDPGRVRGYTRKDLGLPVDADMTVGLFARVEPVKGHHILIDSVRNLRGQGIRIGVLIVGARQGDRYAGELRKLVVSCGLADSIVIRDAVSDIERYYSAIDVAVNWRVDAEPFGISILEAMLMAKPVLAHGLGGPSETVIDGQTGWLAPDPSSGTLSRFLIRVAEERGRWDTYGRSGRRRARDLFGQGERTKRYCQLIEGGARGRCDERTTG